MIVQQGFKEPTAAQRSWVRAHACYDFLKQAILPIEFLEALPCPTGWKVDPSAVLALKGRHVEAHEDPWVGFGKPPKRYLAAFWLIHSPAIGYAMNLHVGAASMDMKEGSFAMFKPETMHSVYGHALWRGLAYQVFKPE